MSNAKFRVYKIFIEEREIKIERKVNDEEKEVQSIRKEGDPYIRRDMREQLEFLLNNSDLFKEEERFVDLIYKGPNGLGAEVFLFITKSNN